MSEETQKSGEDRARGMIASGGVLAGAFAALGASCCVLPIILVNLGVSSALVANLAVFARARELLMVLTIALVAAGSWFAFRGRRRPRSGFWIALAVALALLAAAFIMPHYERELLQWVRPQ